MPMPGDQHRDTPATTNPFLDQGQRITQYSAKEIATLQSRLDKQLGPEYISTRPGNGGGKVHYLAAEKVINLANEVFGFNGWSSSIQNVQIDFVDENPQSQRINLGLSTIVRVTLRDGTFHEDIGYGHCENTKGKAAAFEKAKKEAATDAMKRALRTFGNVLGNCLYDKDYLQKVAKVKVAPSKWDAENLHRHPDFAPIKREAGAEDIAKSDRSVAIQRNASVQSVQSAASFGSGEFEDDFGGNLLDESDFDHPDEVRIDDSAVTNGVASPATNNVAQHNGQRQSISRTHSMPQIRQPNVQAPPPVQGVQAPQKPQGVTRPPQNVGQTPNAMLPPQTAYSQNNLQHPNKPQLQQNQGSSRSNPSSGNTADASRNQALPQDQSNGQTRSPAAQHTDTHSFPIPREPPVGAPGGFISGKKADLLNQASNSEPPGANIAFNPHADSPSIRRTHGVNPGKSAPVSRMQVGGANGPQSPAPQHPVGGGPLSGGGSVTSGAPRAMATNYVNPSADMNRKIGMPGTPGGHQNRAAYRPPTANGGVKRPAMTDVTNTYQTDGASDVKRPKVDGDGDESAQNADSHTTAT